MSEIKPSATGAGRIQGLARRRFLSSFHPGSFPLMARLSYGREISSWLLLPLMLGGLQGGTMAIFVKKTFEGVEGISDEQLNFAVGIVAASKAIGHLTSFLWASLSHGRPKIQFIVHLQLLSAATVGLLAFTPRSPAGLWMITVLCIVAWMVWSGVVTLRASVWRANYHYQFRPRIAGKLATAEALLIALAGIVIGALLDWNVESYRGIFPLLAAIGVAGACIYRAMPFRREQSHLAAEQASSPKEKPTLSPANLIRVLREDRWYRSYMACMFAMGFGNLMLHPMLAIVLADRFEVGYRSGIAIATVIPLLTMTLAIPFWSRLLEKLHVIDFRAIHVWTFASASAFVVIGVVTHQILLLYLAAFTTGIGWGGGALAWNLGHQHFAPRDRDAEYMGVHITLTGIRGTLGPILGVMLYQWSGSVTAFLVCLAMNLVGGIGFVRLAHRRRRHHERKQRAETTRRVTVDREVEPRAKVPEEQPS